MSPIAVQKCSRGSKLGHAFTVESKRGVVPGVGVEPTWPCGRGILSPMRLPVSPPGPMTMVPHCAARGKWRPGSELNRRTRLCRPLHDHSATRPWVSKRAATLSTGVLRVDEKHGAGNETRTRDPDLGKVVLYQLSYSRM